MSRVSGIYFAEKHATPLENNGIVEGGGGVLFRLGGKGRFIHFFFQLNKNNPYVLFFGLGFSQNQPAPPPPGSPCKCHFVIFHCAHRPLFSMILYAPSTLVARRIPFAPIYIIVAFYFNPPGFPNPLYFSHFLRANQGFCDRGSSMVRLIIYIIIGKKKLSFSINW